VALVVALVIVGAGVGLAFLFSPIWVPVLALVGVIALVRKIFARPARAAA
jgi:hypothetical protein